MNTILEIVKILENNRVIIGILIFGILNQMIWDNLLTVLPEILNLHVNKCNMNGAKQAIFRTNLLCWTKVW